MLDAFALSEKHARCKLPTDVGFCRSFQERFYYDSVDHQCKTFSWGGCLGNANNFASADDCLAACGQVKPAAGVAVGKNPLHPRLSDISFIFFSIYPARTSIARARARFEVEAIENDHFEIAAKDSVCTFGNETMNLGDRLASEDPCEECICSTPPEITCTKHTCPPPPDMPGAICQAVAVPGRCCPDYGCVSANPPFIDVCQVSSSNAELHPMICHNAIVLMAVSRVSFVRWANTAKSKLQRAPMEVG